MATPPSGLGRGSRGRAMAAGGGDRPVAGRGRGILAARQALAEQTIPEEPDITLDDGVQPPPAPVGRGRGRSALLAMEAAYASMSVDITRESEDLPSGSRGRGLRMAARLREGNDDAMSFCSEDFVASSRINEPLPDVDKLKEKYKQLGGGGPKSRPASPQVLLSSSSRVASPLPARLAASPSPARLSSPPLPEGKSSTSPALSTPSPPSSSGPVLYRGTEGQPVAVTANYLTLSVDEGCGMFEYHVRFEPEADSRDVRYSAVNQHRPALGGALSYNCGNSLSLPRKLPNHVTVLKSKHKFSGDDVVVTVSFNRELGADDRQRINIYNSILHRAQKALKLAEHAKRGVFYDPEAARDIPDFRLSVWPGYVTSVDEFEGGLQLQVDVTHRVLRTDTARDVLTAILNRNRNAAADAEKAVLGASVLTRYNNKSYIVDGVDFEQSPLSTFVLSSGEEVTYAEYYRRQYNITIKDVKQPLLVHMPKKKSSSEAERVVMLVPELCIMTGLTEAMRTDFRLMKEVGGITRLSPQHRQAALRNFVARIVQDESAHTHLKEWGLTVCPDTARLDARRLPPEQIVFGKNYRETVRDNADWGRSATSRTVLTAVPVNKWAVVFVDKNRAVVRSFCAALVDQGRRMGIAIAQPRVVELPNDRTETYLAKVRPLIDPSVQLVVAVFPQMRSDRYAAIKKLCCVERPVASQVVNVKTISNDKKLMSVSQKIALQINCKLGGELWACTTPFRDLMVVGIDVYHDAGLSGGGSIAGVVCSLNDVCSRYYSSTAEQKKGQELMDALTIAFIEGLIEYRNVNDKFPSNIVVFRDGVGDGQLDATEQHEVRQFLRVFDTIQAGDSFKGTEESRAAQSKLSAMLPDNYVPGFTFVVVQKRINTRILAVVRKGSADDFANPPTGTVVDHTVTRRHRRDFFLVPQSAGQGTVAPTHFVVLATDGGRQQTVGVSMGPNEVMKLSYKLTHMYYNWPGTVRVPAPVQYAHKLADLVGQHVRRAPAVQLNNKLYYL